MPDTGAPWNIPYVESTDLVSDWPTDSLALANAIDAGLDAADNAGIGSNVVQTVKTDIFTTTSTSITDITGLSVTITPSSATSKILVLVMATATMSNSSDTTHIHLFRDATQVFLGDTSGTRTRAMAGISGGSASGPENRQSFALSGVYLDSPATTSAVTYKVRVSVSGNTAYINANPRATDADDTAAVSSITAIEVAA